MAAKRSGSLSRNSAELPETTSFYQQNIQSSRASLNSSRDRFHSLNNLHREGSLSRASYVSADDEFVPVDDEIAQGLGEEVDADADRRSARSGRSGRSARSGGRARQDEGGLEYSADYDGFLPARDRDRPHSILPPSAFYAPKKPPMSHSPRSPLSPLPPLGIADGSRTHTPSYETYSLDGGLERSNRGDPVPMDQSGRERGLHSHYQPGLGPAYTASTDELEGRRQSKSSTGLDQSAVDSYRQAEIRGKPSQDGLLSAQDRTHQDGSSKRSTSYWTTAKKASQSKQVRSSAAGGVPEKKPEGKKIRRYKSHRGANRFFLCGLIMTSDDNPFPFIASLVIMFALPILFLIFVAPFTWRHVSPAPVIIFAYLWAVGATSMCVTAWRDPGVIPRDLDPDPPCTAGDEGNTLSISDPLAVPLPRVVRVRNGSDLNVKWCDTCGTYRPPRCSHCRVCDNCVENIDHHCTFLNTCIGRRNYFSFFAFLLTSILACYLAIAFCVLHIYLLTRPTTSTLPGGGFGEGKNFRQALQAAPLSAVIFFLAVGIVIPLMTLFGYHVRLISMNRTTVEQIRINATSTYSEKPISYEEEEARDRASPSSKSCFKMGIPGRDPNPFAHRTIFRNVKTSLLRPMTAYSWIDRYRFQSVDERKPNPAFSSAKAT